jgi:hypothetical protein
LNVKSLLIDPTKRVTQKLNLSKQPQVSSPMDNKIAVKVEYIHRSMRVFVDGYLCLLTITQSNKQNITCTCWVPRSFITGTDSTVPMDFIKIEANNIKSVSETKFVGQLDNAIHFVIIEKDKEISYQFLFADQYKRDAAFNDIQKFHIDKNRFFESTRLTKDDNTVDFNTALDFHRAIINKKIKKRIEISDTSESKRIAGFPISEPLKFRFGITDPKIRLMTQVACHDANTKQPGILYVFTNSICFDPSVAANNLRMTIYFNDLSKISKIKHSSVKSFANGIKISDIKGRNHIFVGFGDYDLDFLELCRGIRESGSTHRVLMKGDDIAAIIKAVSTT